MDAFDGVCACGFGPDADAMSIGGPVRNWVATIPPKGGRPLAHGMRASDEGPKSRPSSVSAMGPSVMRPSQNGITQWAACGRITQLMLKVSPVIGNVSVPLVYATSTPYWSWVGTSLAFA